MAEGRRPPESRSTVITVRTELGAGRVIENRFTVPFSAIETASIKAAYDIVSSQRFIERAVTGSGASRELYTGVPWGGELINRRWALARMRRTVQQIDAYLTREATRPGTFDPTEIDDLQRMRENLSRVLPPKKSEKRTNDTAPSLRLPQIPTMQDTSPLLHLPRIPNSPISPRLPGENDEAFLERARREFEEAAERNLEKWRKRLSQGL